MNNKQWKQKFRDILFHTPVTYLELEDFISALLKEREAEIRKETIKAVMKITDKGFDCVCSGHIKDLAKEKFNITI
jgi:hypothetical protein